MAETRIVRRILRAVGHNRSFTRRLPPEFLSLKFVTSTEGGLKLLSRDLTAADPPLTQFARKWLQPGQVVWDIGANVGLFTFLAAGRVGRAGRVLSIEPDAWLTGQLRRSARMNASTVSVDVLPVAIADEVRISTLHIAVAARAVSYIDDFETTISEGSREDQLVPTVTLDWLLDHYGHAPDAVKIDVETAELLVLRGAATMLTKVRPVFLIEVSDERSLEVTEIFQQHGYRLLDAGSPAYPPVSSAPFMTVAVPE